MIDLCVLSGGLGGARLALALREAGAIATATFITNVADDWDVDGLLVCPDTDAVLYALANRFDEERGWGVQGDEFSPPVDGRWFNVGRLDRVLHERRRTLLDEGRGLGEVTALLAHELGVEPGIAVLPASDDRVRTRVRSGDDWRGFQEWLVRDRCVPPVDEVVFEGADRARAVVMPEAGTYVLAPSSPVASLAPIFAVGVHPPREQTIAVCPVVARRPPVTDRDRHRHTARAALLGAFGVDHDPVAVARWLAPHAATLVLDPVDRDDAPAIEEVGLDVVVAPTIADSPQSRAALLATLLETSANT